MCVHNVCPVSKCDEGIKNTKIQKYNPDSLLLCVVYETDDIVTLSTLLNICITALAGHEVSRIVSCAVAKHADETAYSGNLAEQHSRNARLSFYASYVVRHRVEGGMDEGEKGVVCYVAMWADISLPVECEPRLAPKRGASADCVSGESQGH